MSLLRHSSYAAIGSLIFGLSQWVITLIIGRILGVEALGQYAYAMAIVIPTFTFAMLGLRPMYISEKKVNFGSYFSARLWLMLLALMGVAIYAFFLADRKAIFMTIVAAGLVKLVDGLSDVVYGGQQRRFEFGWILSSQVTRSGLILIATLFTALFAPSLPVVVWIQAGASFLGFLLIDRCTPSMRLAGEPAGSSLICLPSRNTASLILQSLPLGMSAALIALIASIPRLFASNAEKELGVFSAVIYIIQIGGLIVLSVGQALNPRLAEAWREDRAAKFLKLMGQGLAVALVVGLVACFLCALAGPQLLMLLYGDEFIVERGVLMLLVIGGGVSYVSYILGYALTSTQIYKPQVPLFALIVLATLFLSWLWIGLAGKILVISLAWVYLASNILTLLLSAATLLFLRGKWLRLEALRYTTPRDDK
ncbi:hypothetical protein [Pleomorphomonas carboxyditropha]|uniref:hypothetical protein n=1 Tax=Pleomorphomonas carboxyditropha TaxID=2023338 RepID=UPI0010543E10|nr:hypothetical protein [Pleomorphomonas carboxyditropha]